MNPGQDTVFAALIGFFQAHCEIVGHLAPKGKLNRAGCVSQHAGVHGVLRHHIAPSANRDIPALLPDLHKMARQSDHGARSQPMH